MTAANPTPSEHWLSQLSASGLEHFCRQTPEIQRKTLDLVDSVPERTSRLMVGTEERDSKGRGSGHMPAFLLTGQQWKAFGSPSSAAEWDAAIGKGGTVGRNGSR
jgi:hypothetical protein